MTWAEQTPQGHLPWGFLPCPQPIQEQPPGLRAGPYSCSVPRDEELCPLGDQPATGEHLSALLKRPISAAGDASAGQGWRDLRLPQPRGATEELTSIRRGCGLLIRAPVGQELNSTDCPHRFPPTGSAVSMASVQAPLFQEKTKFGSSKKGSLQRTAGGLFFSLPS